VIIQKEPMQHKPLTLREREVLDLFWLGLSTKEISRELRVSVSRVAGIRRSLGIKLSVSSSWQLCRRALELGFVRLQSKGDRP
jgi:DNA-binding NarL/FixJ family response regulator